MQNRSMLALLLGLLFGAAAGAGAVYLFVKPKEVEEEMPTRSTAKSGLPSLKSSPRSPDLEDALHVLDRFVGEWQTTETHLPSEWTKEKKQRQGEATTEWVLDRRFLLTKMRFDDGLTSLFLRTYDPDKKEYRIWSFDSNGSFIQSRGRWNDKTATMTTESTTPDGYASVLHARSLDHNRGEIEIKVMNKNKLMFHMQGKATRREK